MKAEYRWAHAYLSKVQTRGSSSVIVFPVHVQHLLALDGQQARQHTFTETRALEGILAIRLVLSVHERTYEHDNLERQVSAMNVCRAMMVSSRRIPHPCCVKSLGNVD